MVAGFREYKEKLDKDGNETRDAQTAKENLAEALKTIGDRTLPLSVIEPCQAIAANLLRSSSAPAASIREIVDLCNSKKASGLYKVVVAVGKESLTLATTELLASSLDETMLRPLQVVMDMTVKLSSSDDAAAGTHAA